VAGDGPEPLVLQPKLRMAWIVIAILAVLTVGFAIGAVLVHWLIWILFVPSACGLAMVWLTTLPGRSYLRLEADGFEIKTPFRTRRFAWRDVTPFVPVRLSYASLVAFRARAAPDAALPPTPEPTKADIASGAEALPENYGRDQDALAALMNEWRERALG
jgi:hypothetical protein